MSILLFALTLFYLSLLLWLSFGLRRLENSNDAIKTPDNNLPTVSLVVCAKNEEQRLPRLLRALAHQDYPSDKLEICLVPPIAPAQSSLNLPRFIPMPPFSASTTPFHISRRKNAPSTPRSGARPEKLFC
jgi:hypothetical protein